jgi:predicted  nucleic acid-binding Zn ribbon protein
MYVAEVIFKQISKPEEGVDVESALYFLLGSLLQNGQLLDIAFLIQRKKDYAAFVTFPDKDSLDNKYGNQYVHDSLTKLESAGFSQPEIQNVNFALETAKICVCKKRNSFILFTTFLDTDSPLQCGNCRGTVPLYNIPKKFDETYNKILSWQSDYKACDTLQMHCETGERFGIKEMSNFDSSLSKRGRKICNEIEKKTGIPTYYYLFRYNGISEKTERQRKCPSCKSDWLLKKPLHEIFDFRCNKCRLLSNMAVSLRR